MSRQEELAENKAKSISDILDIASGPHSTVVSIGHTSTTKGNVTEYLSPWSVSWYK